MHGLDYLFLEVGLDAGPSSLNLDGDGDIVRFKRNGR